MPHHGHTVFIQLYSSDILDVVLGHTETTGRLCMGHSGSLGPSVPRTGFPTCFSIADFNYMAGKAQVQRDRTYWIWSSLVSWRQGSRLLAKATIAPGKTILHSARLGIFILGNIWSAFTDLVFRGNLSSHHYPGTQGDWVLLLTRFLQLRFPSKNPVWQCHVCSLHQPSRRL